MSQVGITSYSVGLEIRAIVLYINSYTPYIQCAKYISTAELTLIYSSWRTNMMRHVMCLTIDTPNVQAELSAIRTALDMP